MTKTAVSPEPTFQEIRWQENGEPQVAAWRLTSGAPPREIVVADDRIATDAALRLIRAGKSLLWRGDFQNARHLLQALARRLDRHQGRQSKHAAHAPANDAGDAFRRYRAAQGRRAGILNQLLIPLQADYTIPLRRAPDVRLACAEAYGPGDSNIAGLLLPLRELHGLIGAHEWRKNGVPVAALQARIHPHYGVFSPVRGEYLELVASAPLPAAALAPAAQAFDIGTGTGVLAALLVRRGVARVIATDNQPRAVQCARENLTRLGLAKHVSVEQADLFPAGQAALIVCNPPWLPAAPATALDAAVLDPDSRMLRGFLAGLAAHLAPGGEGWLILSDLAEHLGLRSRQELLTLIAAAGLRVAGRLDARPTHRRASDTADPLHAARAAEITSLWRLVAQGQQTQ
jgi:methylase of polypeptide subunit release factors